MEQTHFVEDLNRRPECYGDEARTDRHDKAISRIRGMLRGDVHICFNDNDNDVTSWIEAMVKAPRSSLTTDNHVIVPSPQKQKAHTQQLCLLVSNILYISIIACNAYKHPRDTRLILSFCQSHSLVLSLTLYRHYPSPRLQLPLISIMKGMEIGYAPHGLVYITIATFLACIICVVVSIAHLYKYTFISGNALIVVSDWEHQFSGFQPAFQ